MNATASNTGRKSRTKGQSGEREVAAIIRDITGWDVQRKVRQTAGDSDLEGVNGWCIEVKRHKTANRAEIVKWWVQAVEQAIKARKVPVLFYRRDRDEWRAVWPKDWRGATVQIDYRWTVEGSVAAWCDEVVGAVK